MAITVSTSVMSNMATAMRTSGTIFNTSQIGGNRLIIYSGTMPAANDWSEATYAGQALAEWGSLNWTADSTAGRVNITSIPTPDVTATGTGTATWCVVRGNTGRWVLADVSENGGSGICYISTVNVVSGNQVTLLSFSIDFIGA